MYPILIKQSESTAARRRVPIWLVDATDGIAAETGVTGTPRLSKNGAASASCSASITQVDSTNMPGLYYVELTAGEVDTLGTVYLSFKTAATAQWHGVAHIVAFDPYDGVRAGLTALPNAAAEAAGGLYTRGTGAGQINQSANGQIDVNVEQWRDAIPNALQSGRVDAYAGALATGVIVAGSFTAGAIDAAAIADSAIDAATFAAGAINAAAIADSAIDAATFASGAVNAAALATDAVEEIADQVWNELRTGHVGAGSFGEGVASVQGNVTGSVGSVAAGGIASTSFAAGAINAAAIADAAIDAATFAAGAIDAAAIADAAIDAATFASGAINAAAIAGDAITAAKVATDAVEEIADQVWNEDIEAAHGGDASAGLLLRALGAAISNRTNNPTLDALLGVADSSGNDVPGQVLAGDTLSELSQGIPAATPTLAAAMMLLYMALRNKRDVTSSWDEIHNDTGTVVCKAALSDDATTFTRAEMVSGP